MTINPSPQNPPPHSASNPLSYERIAPGVSSDGWARFHVYPGATLQIYLPVCCTCLLAVIGISSILLVVVFNFFGYPLRAGMGKRGSPVLDLKFHNPEFVKCLEGYVMSPDEED